MSTSTLETSKPGQRLQSTENEPAAERKIIENKFYLTVNWKILSSKVLDENETNRVISRISEFYQNFLAKKGTRLITFRFDLDLDRECSQFNLRVTLSSDFFIHTNALTPSGLDLDECAGENGTMLKDIELSLPPQPNPGPGAGPRIPVNTELTSISLAYAAAPPQNTGHTGPGTL